MKIKELALFGICFLSASVMAQNLNNTVDKMFYYFVGTKEFTSKFTIKIENPVNCRISAEVKQKKIGTHVARNVFKLYTVTEASNIKKEGTKSDFCEQVLNVITKKEGVSDSYRIDADGKTILSMEDNSIYACADLTEKGSCADKNDIINTKKSSQEFCIDYIKTPKKNEVNIIETGRLCPINSVYGKHTPYALARGLIEDGAIKAKFSIEKTIMHENLQIKK